MIDFGELQGYFTLSYLNESGQNESRFAGLVPLKKYCYVLARS